MSVVKRRGAILSARKDVEQKWMMTVFDLSVKRRLISLTVMILVLVDEY